jgi:hypothetical protein
MFSKRSSQVAKRPRLRRGLSVLVGVLVVGAVAASPAAATFAAPFDVSEPAFSPDVGVDTGGDAVFTWQGYNGANYRVQTRTRSAAGALSGVRNLSAAGQDAEFPQVAVDSGGDAVFVWMRFDGANHRVQARTRSAAGVLSPVQDLSASGQDGLFPQVAVDPAGDAVFTWTRFDGATDRVQTRARSAAGALSAVRNLSTAGQYAYDPRVAVDTGGDAVFTWRLFDGATSNYRVQTRARSAAGALSAVQNLSAAGETTHYPRVAVDPAGDAVFAWTRFDGATDRVQTRARSAAGALSPVQNLSAAGQYALFPEVADDGDGNAVFTWVRYDGANDRVQALTRSAAGVLSPVQDLSGSGQDAEFPQVALDTGGDAVFTWQRADHPGVDVVQARERSAAGALFAVQTLSDGEGSATVPQVGVDGGGDAVVTWLRSDATTERIQAATGP